MDKSAVQVLAVAAVLGVIYWVTAGKVSDSSSGITATQGASSTVVPFQTPSAAGPSKRDTRMRRTATALSVVGGLASSISTIVPR
jgi:hypothetical protein